MKLVTGIEAIQSGKPWKHKNKDTWKDPGNYIGNLTCHDLLVKEFIIKEEPREFWFNTHTGVILLYDASMPNEENWIRVREIEK